VNILPSYVLIPLPTKKLDKDKIVTQVKQLPATEDVKEFREGTLPETLTATDEAIGFIFAFEYELPYQTLEGPKTIKACRKVPIVFLEANFLLIGNCTKDIEQRVVGFIEKNLVNGFVLNKMKFDEQALRTVIEKCPDVSQLDITPGMERVDKISCIGREITGSEFYEDYGGEPLSKVKVSLREVPEEARVGFDKKGIITIYNADFTFEQQIMVLKYVVQKIIGPSLKLAPFQKKLM
jgi:hypothetical protein